MGLRVRGILVLFSLLAIAALAVPLALSSAERRTASLAEERSRQLTAMADEAALDGVPLQPLVDRYHDVYGEEVLVVDADGRMRAAAGLDTEDPGVAAAVARALVDEPAPEWERILPWDRDPVLAAAPVRRHGEPAGAVVISVHRDAAAADVTRSWVWVGLGCLGLVALAVVVAGALTRWVLRPMHGLERAVADMTRGVAGPPVSVAGPPELRHFAAAFNTMAEVVRGSLERQRRLVADASHQLRNPLAAVRLRADSLDDHVAPEGRATYDAMTAELDRLEDLLQQLLRLARAEELSGSRQVGLDRAGDSTRIDDVVRDRVEFWSPVVDGHEQRLVPRIGNAGLAVRVDEHEVAQLLDVALDNAARYAGPGATITVSAVDRGAVIELVVSDDGPGLPAVDLHQAAERFWRGQDAAAGSPGTGLGLAIAREIVQGHRGSFRVERAPEGGLLVRFGLPAAGGES